LLAPDDEIRWTCHREIREAEDSPDFGRAEHLPECVLDALFHLADLAPDGREPAAGGIQDLAPAVEAPLDRHDEAREFAHTLAEPAQARELVADPGEPSFEIADGAERLDRLSELLGFEDPPTCDDAPGTDVMKRRTMVSTPRRLLPFRGHLPVVNHGIDAGLNLMRRGPAEQAARAATELEPCRIPGVPACLSMLFTARAPLRPGGESNRPGRL
jgi:hypothetical protein